MFMENLPEGITLCKEKGIGVDYWLTPGIYSMLSVL